MIQRLNINFITLTKLPVHLDAASKVVTLSLMYVHIFCCYDVHNICIIIEMYIISLINHYVLLFIFLDIL